VREPENNVFRHWVNTQLAKMEDQEERRRYLQTVRDIMGAASRELQRLGEEIGNAD